MNAARFTGHGARQLQRRGIPPMVVDLLEQCGSVQRRGKADQFFFDKAARKRLTRHFGGKRGLRLIERWIDVYAVIGDNGSVITVDHRRRR